jgi:phospholipid/cholesterol/gamma-HCH transport system permease protein
MEAAAAALPRIERRPDGEVCLLGDWTHRALVGKARPLRDALAGVAPGVAWNLDGIGVVDSFGALLIWRAWGRQWPAGARIPEAARQALARLEAARGDQIPREPAYGPADLVVSLGAAMFGLRDHLADFVVLLGRIFLDLAFLLRDPAHWPLREISANLHKVGVKAMPVAALVGFLIGVVLSYLSALQLKTFGADALIVNILGLGVVRELGPVLVSVLVAGRSGSAMTAQLGVMRVTEEIDALTTMGISRYTRLVLPKVLALTCAMPLLVLWTSTVALLGGMVTADLQLDLGYGFFLQTLARVVPVANVYIGLAKGAVFGLLIALVACHFGLRVKPNTESLSTQTTASVVTAITVVILADALFAIATRAVGVPG